MNPILFLDAASDLDIRGPPIVIAGDNVTIKCCASKKMYQNNIKWTHRSTNNEEIPISTNESENNLVRLKIIFTCD